MKKLIRTEPGRGAIKKTKTRETFERKLLSNKHKTVYPFLILAALYAFSLMKIIGEFRVPVRREERVLVRSLLGVGRLGRCRNQQNLAASSRDHTGEDDTEISNPAQLLSLF
jgi:hypothetical protein